MKKQPQQPEQQRSDYSASALSEPPDRASGDRGARALNDVAAERLRQIEREVWTPGHDDNHIDRELARAALSYTKHYVERQWIYEAGNHDDYQGEESPDEWPWDNEWWKPKNPRRDLVRAAALIVAEIERIDRATPLPVGHDASSEPRQNETAAVDSAPSLSGAPTEQKDAYRAFYEAVAECFGDTWQCPCGRAEDWWIDSNADYATREIRAALQTVQKPNNPNDSVADFANDLAQTWVKSGDAVDAVAVREALAELVRLDDAQLDGTYRADGSLTAAWKRARALLNGEPK